MGPAPSCLTVVVQCCSGLTTCLLVNLSVSVFAVSVGVFTWIEVEKVTCITGLSALYFYASETEQTNAYTAVRRSRKDQADTDTLG